MKVMKRLAGMFNRPKIISFVNKAWVVLFLACYPLSVMAAGAVANPETPVDYKKVMYVVFMSFWGGMAAFTQKIAKDTVGSRWKQILAADLTNATLAAFLVFLACDYYKVAPELSAIIYTLAGYGGSKFMEWAYDKFMAQANTLVKGGAPNDNTPSN